ncbi:proton channel otopetrin-like a isoform X4 [Haematobia irritans]|uniref:proton channel otopetrin-like a isoform X4 n=1 Tax=Haematobia irritans TaxID=7368 RepID=UPI003F50D070
MQRCPYIHEMRERLLNEQNRESLPLEQMERANLLDNRQSAELQQVGTIVKLNGDGYHTSPAHQRTPLVPRDLGEDFNLDFDDDFPIEVRRPKNANNNQERKSSSTNLEHVSASPSKRTSLFIVTSLVYAIILIVVCIAYVISDVTTHRLPVLYYESFFTYLYGVSILFLLYVFCFLLQESSCCNGGNNQPKSPKKEKKSKKKEKDPADSKDAKGSKDSGKSGKPSPYQISGCCKILAIFVYIVILIALLFHFILVFHWTISMVVFLVLCILHYLLIPKVFHTDTQVDAEVAVTPKNTRKRKTTHSDLTHGSFFLRVGAIAFGLGAMIYIGLEFGSFFEIPFDSPCHHILIGVNPLLQMIFTFMQMYFIFMNARLNIHRFKVIARFGLMHVVATNICVWIRTLVKESLLEITLYHQKREADPNESSIGQSIRQHALRHAGTVLRTHYGPNEEFEVLDGEDLLPKNAYTTNGAISKMLAKTMDGISKTLGMGSNEVADMVSSSTTTTTTGRPMAAAFTTPSYQWQSTTVARKLKKFITSTTAAATMGTTPSTTTTTSTTTTSTALPVTSRLATTTTTELPFNSYQHLYTTTASPAAAAAMADHLTNGVVGTGETTDNSNMASSVASFFSSLISSTPSPITSTTTTNIPITASTASSLAAKTTENSFGLINNLMENSFQTFSGISHPEAASIVTFENYENLDNIYPAALSSNVGTLNSTACGRIDIMGTIVYDSAPYLYPFIIEYSLIGAVVLYVMWKHIGRYPGRMNDDDLEHRLEVMLSRRAVVMAQQARSGRVDCVGSSKGLFFGLLLLVGALICLILFFVLVRHQQFSLLAIYLADASHCVLMVFAILAIIIGFIRVKNLKFRCEEQSNLNDILLRISAFGLFTYSVFSVISGSLKVLEHEPSLLVTTTSAVAVLQVILQLLFIADVSRRRVHLPEHDRSKPGRQIVTFLLICNVAMFAIYTFDAQKVYANPVSRYVQLDFYGFVPWAIIQRVTLPLCIFHRFHSAVTLAEIWKTTYKARLE